MGKKNKRKFSIVQSIQKEPNNKKKVKKIQDEKEEIRNESKLEIEEVSEVSSNNNSQVIQKKKNKVNERILLNPFRFFIIKKKNRTRLLRVLTK